jgi:OOP family OmpA-OmpF porin
MKAIQTTSMALLAAGLMSAGLQAEEVGKDYVDIMGTYMDADSERNLEGGVGGVDIRVGRAFGDLWNLELAGNYISLDGDPRRNGNDFPGWTQGSLGINGLIVMNRDGRFQPYVLAGVGGNSERYDGNQKRENLYGDLGLGAIVPIFENRGRLRAEVKYRGVDNVRELNSNDNATGGTYSAGDLLVNVGFGIPFGAVAAAPVAAVVAAPLFLDGDGDGVEDSKDKCPGTPKGAPVDEFGCEFDSDGDGVVDSQDQCPGTPAGVKVDAIGCPPEIVLERVFFKFDSAELTDASIAVLDENIARGQAVKLLQNPAVRIEVAGHTDSVGNDAYNQLLSERRANTVRDFLISRGVPADRLTAKGYGETDPIADNSTAEGRAQNRRVGLRIKKD